MEFVISVETRIAGRKFDVLLLLHGHLGVGPGICALIFCIEGLYIND
jgi:hypothetical protein